MFTYQFTCQLLNTFDLIEVITSSPLDVGGGGGLAAPDPGPHGAAPQRHTAPRGDGVV
jgi:hypothetical protein